MNMGKKFNIVLVLFALLTFNTIVSSVSASNLTAALDWLRDNQNASGNWFFLTPWGTNNIWSPQTSLSAVALYWTEGNSSNVTQGLAWLSQLENFSEWQSGESIGDVVGTALYTFSQTSHLDSINVTSVSKNLLTFQDYDGGIKGWFDCQWNGTACTGSNTYVSDSADTAWALIGLISANSINDANKSSAINFLESMQNSDGSINLTNTTDASVYEGLSPDKWSNTALYLIAAKYAGVSNSNTSLAASYLKNINIACSPTATISLSQQLAINNTQKIAVSLSSENKSYSYTVALAAWASSKYGYNNHAKSMVNYLTVLQNNSNGGFSDSRRSTNPTPIPLDTAMATIAMENAGTNNTTETWCTDKNYISANITFPNGTILQMNLIFNSTSYYYEGSFLPDINGTYNIIVSTDTIFFGNITANSSFDAKKIDGSDCSSYIECLGGYCVYNICRSFSTYCGDGHCDSGESCSSCSNDCGQCQTSSPSSSDGSSNLTTSTTSTATTSTTTTIKTTSTTTSTTIPVTTTTTKTTTTAQSTPLTGMFSIISTYRWQLVLFIAAIAFIIFLLRREGIIP
jgi:hypothetical protein